MKRFSRLNVLIAALVVVALFISSALLSVSPARAFTLISYNGIISIIAQHTCTSSSYGHNLTFNRDDDGAGSDNYSYGWVDGNGKTLFFVDVAPGAGGPNTADFMVGLNGATARPITFYLFDRTASAATPGATSQAQLTYALANYAIDFQSTDDPVALGITSCAGLPLVTSSSATGGPTSNPAEPFFQSSVPAQSIDAFKAAEVPHKGVLPLAIFEPHWWGVKTLNSTHFPAVTDWTQAEVYCLDSSGNWTGEYVSTWSESEAVLQVYIKQHGICGIFPKV